MLISEILAISDMSEIMFVRTRDGWHWGKIEKDSNGKLIAPKYMGPHSNYLKARESAWQSVIVGTAIEGPLLNQVGYAWEKWVEAHSQIV